MPLLMPVVAGLGLSTPLSLLLVDPVPDVVPVTPVLLPKPASGPVTGVKLLAATRT